MPQSKSSSAAALVALCACLGLAACDMGPSAEERSEAAKKADAHTELRDMMEEDKIKARDADALQQKRAEEDRKAIEDAGG
jgi:hypothetical protein